MTSSKQIFTIYPSQLKFLNFEACGWRLITKRLIVQSLLTTWWFERKNFQESVVTKVFLVKLSKVRTVTMKQLVCNVFSIKFAIIWVIAELCTVCQTRIITKTKQLIRKISWILWRSPLFQLLFLATRLTKEPSFDWFKSHSPLFESQ